MDASSLESRRFQRRVQRFSFDALDRDAVKTITSAAPDLAIVRIPSSQLHEAHRLAVLAASPIVADTLVYYGCDLATAEPRPLRNESLRFRLATPDDLELLRELVEVVFDGYHNHYSSNPMLDPADIAAGYTEWGLSFIDPGSPYEAWLAYDGDRVAGFANCETAGTTYRGVLYGVHPDFAGRGVYGDLIAFTQAQAKQRGLDRMEVSTQIDNIAVQKAWVRNGILLEKSLNTIHLNLFLSEDHFLAEHHEDVKITPELVEQFAELSDDRNPVHFDDEAARAAGFDGRIAHGVILNALISRGLAGDLPGPGTIYLQQSSTFLRPVPVGSVVTVRLLLKHVDPATGRHTIATRVHDEAAAMVFCGVASVLKR